MTRASRMLRSAASVVSHLALAPSTPRAATPDAAAERARHAAAAAPILAMGDPGERRWKFSENLITIRPVP